MSDEVSETVNENQKLSAQEETDHETSSKSETAERKRSQESRRWEKAGRKKTDKQKQHSSAK